MLDVECWMFGMREQRGHFEQEATERTERGSTLCFLRYLLLDLEAAAYRPIMGISFRVFRVVRGYIPRAVTSPVVTPFL